MILLQNSKLVLVSEGDELHTFPEERGVTVTLPNKGCQGSHSQRNAFIAPAARRPPPPPAPARRRAPAASSASSPPAPPFRRPAEIARPRSRTARLAVAGKCARPAPAP